MKDYEYAITGELIWYLVRRLRCCVVGRGLVWASRVVEGGSRPLGKA